MEIFKAKTQYNDLQGSVAADNADHNDAIAWLVKNGHIHDSAYFVCGIKMCAGENHGKHQDPVNVTFLLLPSNNRGNFLEKIEANDIASSVKEIQVQMNILDFFSLFKRLEIAISTKGILEGKSIR